MTDVPTWQTCRIGSCHRHQECMYTPCRAVPRSETWTLNRRESKVFVDTLLNPPEPNKALKVAAARYVEETLK